MPDPIKKKKKKATVTPSKKNAAMVQAPAGKGASRNVRTNSAAGKQVAKAKMAADIKKKGKKLLRSEEYALRKSFNTTRLRKKKK